eukprot:767706-Hanusia_phi.AAC.3
MREWELSAEAQVDDPEQVEPAQLQLELLSSSPPPTHCLQVFVSMGPEDVRQTPRPLKLPSPLIALELLEPS